LNQIFASKRHNEAWMANISFCPDEAHSAGEPISAALPTAILLRRHSLSYSLQNNQLRKIDWHCEDEPS